MRHLVEKEGEPPRGAPGVVVVLIGLLVAAHLYVAILSVKDAEAASQALAFIPMRYHEGGRALPGGDLALVFSPITYMLVHADWSHLAVNAIWLLIFGTMVARRTGAMRFLAMTLATGLAGILLFWALHTSDESIVVGISGAVSGLMAGGVRLLHAASLEGRGPAFMLSPMGVLPRLAETLRHPPSQVIIGIWLVLNVAIAVAARLFSKDFAIAWEVHLGGFLLGLLAFPLFDRPASVAMEKSASFLPPDR
jgi:membrane associated rhomboid family serine protease